MSDSASRPVPSGYQVIDTPDLWEARWSRYRTFQARVSLVFGVVLFGVLLVLLVRKLDFDFGKRPMDSTASMLFCGLVTWSGVAQLFNRTRVRIRGDVLSVRGAPIPWFGGGRWKRAEIERVKTTTGIRSRNASDVPVYGLKLVLRGGRKVAVVRDLATWDEATFLYAEVTRRLGLPTR